MHTIIHSICGKPDRAATRGCLKSVGWRGFAERPGEDIAVRPNDVIIVKEKKINF